MKSEGGKSERVEKLVFLYRGFVVGTFIQNRSLLIKYDISFEYDIFQIMVIASKAVKQVGFRLTHLINRSISCRS